MAKQVHGAVVYGIDLGKTWFHVVGHDATGRSLHTAKLSRSKICTFFADTSAALIGMEACATSHYWARELAKLGHEVRLMPAMLAAMRLNKQKSTNKSSNKKFRTVLPKQIL